MGELEGLGQDHEAGGRGMGVAWGQLLGGGKVYRRSGRRPYGTSRGVSSCPATAGTEAV